MQCSRGSTFCFFVVVVAAAAAAAAGDALLNYCELAECSATLRVFMENISEKKFRKKIQVNFKNKTEKSVQSKNTRSKSPLCQDSGTPHY
jgi:hypothetical protein